MSAHVVERNGYRATLTRIGRRQRLLGARWAVKVIPPLGHPYTRYTRSLTGAVRFALRATRSAS